MKMPKDCTKYLVLVPGCPNQPPLVCVRQFEPMYDSRRAAITVPCAASSHIAGEWGNEMEKGTTAHKPA